MPVVNILLGIVSNYVISGTKYEMYACIALKKLVTLGAPLTFNLLPYNNQDSFPQTHSIQKVKRIKKRMTRVGRANPFEKKRTPKINRTSKSKMTKISMSMKNWRLNKLVT